MLRASALQTASMLRAKRAAWDAVQRGQLVDKFPLVSTLRTRKSFVGILKAPTTTPGHDADLTHFITDETALKRQVSLELASA